jgi:hypothetical protein
MADAPSPSRAERVRTGIGLGLALLSLAALAAQIAFRDEIFWLRFEEGCEWVYERLYLIWTVAALFLLDGLVCLAPVAYRALRARRLLLSVGSLFLLAPIALGLLLTGTIAGMGFVLEGRNQVLHLEGPRPYDKAVILTGSWMSDYQLWALEPGGDRMEERGMGPEPLRRVSWPVSLRKAEGRPLYLVVDSESMAVTFVDLTWDRGTDPPDPLSTLEEVRAVFGSDVGGLLWVKGR